MSLWNGMFWHSSINYLSKIWHAHHAGWLDTHFKQIMVIFMGFTTNESCPKNKSNMNHINSKHPHFNLNVVTQVLTSYEKSGVCITPTQGIDHYEESYICVMWHIIVINVFDTKPFCMRYFMCVQTFKRRCILILIIKKYLVLMVCGAICWQHIVPLVKIIPLWICEPWQGMQHIMYFYCNDTTLNLKIGPVVYFEYYPHYPKIHTIWSRWCKRKHAHFYMANYMMHMSSKAS